MKIAIVGSRGVRIDHIEKYLPDNVTEIVSVGAKGVDFSAHEYALSHGIKLTEFLPEYSRYGRAAPIKRKLEIIEYADEVIAFWDGVSRGTKFVIDSCEKTGVKIKVVMMQPQNK